MTIERWRPEQESARTPFNPSRQDTPLNAELSPFQSGLNGPWQRLIRRAPAPAQRFLARARRARQDGLNGLGQLGQLGQVRQAPIVEFSS